MPRFFVDQQPQDGVLTLTGENAHHAGRVLRLRVGEGVTLCDGAGMVLTARWKPWRRKP